MKFIGLNHVAIHVRDVERSIDFYGKKLGLNQIARPAFDFPGAWFELDDGRQLHLIGGLNVTVHSSNRGNHFAIEVDSISETTDFLRSRILKLWGRRFGPTARCRFF